MCSEKQSNSVPCAHYLLAYLQYKPEIHIDTVQKNIKTIVKEYQNSSENVP